MKRLFATSKKKLLGRIVPAEEVAGILVEPIQGEGGYIVPASRIFPGFAQTLRSLRDPVDRR